MTVGLLVNFTGVFGAEIVMSAIFCVVTMVAIISIARMQ